MSLDVVCDVVVTGDPKELAKFVNQLDESWLNLEGSVNEFKILTNETNEFQFVYLVPYTPPLSAIKKLATKFSELSFTITFEDEIGNGGKYLYKLSEETKLDYVTFFSTEMSKLVQSGELPPFGIVITGSDEDDLDDKVVEYATSRGYEPEVDEKDDLSGFALDWLQENISLGYGCFEIEDLNLVFRPWTPEEF